jgi:hypothetical protein
MAERQDALRESFIGILIIDVMIAQRRWKENDVQSTRRDLIRTMFAAIEGLVWEYREQVRSDAKVIDDLPIIVDLALLEKSYTVSETGKVTEQQRFVSLTTMIRLVTKVAEIICPGLKVDFSDAGWASLKIALKIRHRVTHPKKIADLSISEEDILTAEKGFFWILDMTASVQECLLSNQKQYLASFSDILAKLQAGDPETVAAYEKQLLKLDD